MQKGRLVTFALRIDGNKECTYGVRHYSEKDEHISYYTFKELSEEQIKEIQEATPMKVQAILSKYI